MQHIIRKQVINLTVNHRLDVFSLQQKVSGVFWKTILPILEKFFDDVSNESETITIEKMEIDLGVVAEKEFLAVTSDSRIEKLILSQLREGIIQSHYKEKENMMTLKNETGAFEQWFSFLKKGYLPWNLLSPPTDWKDKVLEALCIDHVSVVKLKEAILADPVCTARLINQHNDNFLSNLLETITAQSQKLIIPFLHDLEVFSTGSRDNLSFRRSLWNLLLREACLRQRQQLQSYELVIMLFNIIGSKSHPIDITFVRRSFPSLCDVAEEVLAASIPNPSYSHNNATEQNQNRGDSPEIFQRNLKVNILEKIKSFEEKRKSQIEDETINSTAELLKQEDVFLDNAGAVLLHPFLNTLFNRTELVEDGRFVNKDAQQKAIYLIHYMVTGNTSGEEYELVVPKILCALPLQEPISVNLQLEPTLKEEGDHLLNEVIAKWQVLKNTSVAGLREGFLQRKGKLSLRKDKMNIHLEVSPIDMLLDHLPWSINIIKLPWMKEFIHVEWR